MTLEHITQLINKHGTITAQPLLDLVVTVVLEAVEATERESRAESERMAETLFRIGEITLAPGNWRTKDQVALNGMVSAVRDMDEALNIVAEIAAAMLRLSKNRKTDWDLHGYALALRGTIMDMGYLKDEP